MMLRDLENNIKILVSAYETQKGRADRLERELEADRKSLEAARDKIKELEDRIDSLSLRSVFVPAEGGNSEAKAEIDRLIQEIDSALALLKQ